MSIGQETPQPVAPKDSAGGRALPTSPKSGDGALLALEKQFNAIAGELLTFQRECNERMVTRSAEQSPDQGAVHQQVCNRSDDEAAMRQTEAILTRLDPIERAIMATPARAIVGLGVKARHAAYVLSEYWSEPIDKIDWDARAIRLLIEAVCTVAHMPLPFGDTGETAQCAPRADPLSGRGHTELTSFEQQLHASAAEIPVCAREARIAASLTDTLGAHRGRLDPKSPLVAPARRIVVTHQHVALTAIEYGNILVTVTSRSIGGESSSFEIRPLPYMTSIAGGPLSGQTWRSRTWNKALYNHVKAVSDVADALAAVQA
jgi:hypothetical protein